MLERLLGIVRHSRLSHTETDVQRRTRSNYTPNCAQRFVRLHAYARLRDWLLPQIGQIDFGATLSDWNPQPIGAFLPQTLVKPLPKQGGRLGSTPNCCRRVFGPFESFLQIDEIGFVFGLSDSIRLGSVKDCQIGPARLAQN